MTQIHTTIYLLDLSNSINFKHCNKLKIFNQILYEGHAKQKSIQSVAKFRFYIIKTYRIQLYLVKILLNYETINYFFNLTAVINVYVLNNVKILLYALWQLSKMQKSKRFCNFKSKRQFFAFITDFFKTIITLINVEIMETLTISII